MAQVLTNAYKLVAKSEHTFVDVDRKSWSNKAISAVQSNRIAAGTGDNMFSPKMNVTREQYVQFLYNATLPYEERPGANQSQSALLIVKKQTMLDIMILQEIVRIMVSI